MHIGDALVALGGAFLAAAVLARLGARIGLPTIPLFMLAGIVLSGWPCSPRAWPRSWECRTRSARS